MKKRTLRFLLFLLLLGVSYYYFGDDLNLPGYTVFSKTGNNEGVKIANWNLQIFGTSKASNQKLMQSYAEKIANYDIVFVQEIRDDTGTAFSQLCDMLSEYNCISSSRAGRSVSKEQYGIIYKNTTRLLETKDYNPDSQDRWERPPIKSTFEFSDYNISIYNIHIKPEDVQRELDFLDDIVTSEGYRAVVGDLNADCSYYNADSKEEFKEFNWKIKDEEDTTVSKTDCAYDRIILNNNANKKFIRYGIDKQVTNEQSDHYLVWFEIEK